MRFVLQSFFAALALLSATAVWGQSTDPINAALQFNFSNPGARSLGLAGAFTARADDATAAYANPAGLVQLRRPEVSAEFRAWKVSNRFLDRGTQQASGELGELEFGTTDDRSEGISFLSATHPGGRGQWVVALFNHQAANFSTRLSTDGVSTFGSDGTSPRLRPIEGIYDLEIETTGASVGLRAGENLAFGMTLSHSRFVLASRTERLDATRAALGVNDRPFFALDPERCCEFASRDDVIVFETQRSDPERDEDLSLTLGFLWQSSHVLGGVSAFSVGGFFRGGPSFGFLGDSFIREAGDALPDGSTESSYDSSLNEAGDPLSCYQDGRPGCPGTFKVPDVYGLGVSWRPSARWVATLDVNRVEYSDLSDQLLDIIGSDSVLQKGESGRPADFAVDDGWEWRVGLERAWASERRPFNYFLRAGVWLDPDHEIRYTGPSPELQARWLGGDDELHAALGFGLRRHRLQIDTALDLSDRLDTLSLTLVYYFRDH